MLVPLLIAGGLFAGIRYLSKPKAPPVIPVDPYYTTNNPVRTPTGGVSNYKVAVGDNFMQVAVRFNTPEGGIISLAKVNPVLATRSPKNTLVPGEVLKVPAGTDRGKKAGAMGTVA